MQDVITIHVLSAVGPGLEESVQMKTRIFGSLLALFLVIGACSDSSNSVVSHLHNETAFMEVEPIEFSFQKGGTPTLTYRSSIARMMYSFFPAHEAVESKPLFVFFNGGPGCSTSTGLLSMNTAPMCIDSKNPSGHPCKSNPYSFTRLGNLLYIDSPNAGFSYNLVRHAEDEDVRKAEFGVQNFNPYIDAAQFIRVILRFLSDHPSIRDNEIILVGESYGGIRASVMLHLLLFYSRYGDGSQIYKDVALSNQIQAHFERRHPEFRGRTVPSKVIAAQFTSQILIAPLIAGEYQNELAGEAFEKPDSVIFWIAEDTDATYAPCEEPSCDPRGNALDFVYEIAERDIYQYDKAAGWSDDIFLVNEKILDQADPLAALLGCDITEIQGLKPFDRTGAYRWIKGHTEDVLSIHGSRGVERLPVEYRRRLEHRIQRMADREKCPDLGDSTTLEDLLGELPFWDVYVLDCNNSVNTVFFENTAIEAGYDELHPLSSAFGALFLQNLVFIKTAITRSELDLVVYAPVIPDMIARYSSTVERVAFIPQDDDGLINVYYRAGSVEGLSDSLIRTIYFPRYADAGHAVTLSRPDKFLTDVTRWIEGAVGAD
jgi:hypothetical protein